MENSGVRKLSGNTCILISRIIIIVQLIAIILIIYNYENKAIAAQTKFDNNFLMYLELSNNSLEQMPQSGDIPDLRINKVQAAASFISNAYGLVEYTTYTKNNVGYGGLLQNYKSVFINVPIEKLISNSYIFVAYMNDILKNPNYKSKIDEFNTYLVNFQYENAKKQP